MLHFFTELALVDLSEGKLELVTLNGISPISIPKLEPTRLQVQVGKDILACSEDSQECKIWMEREYYKAHFLSKLTSKYTKSTC